MTEKVFNVVDTRPTIGRDQYPEIKIIPFFDTRATEFGLKQFTFTEAEKYKLREQMNSLGNLKVGDVVYASRTESGVATLGSLVPPNSPNYKNSDDDNKFWELFKSGKIFGSF